MDNTEQDTTQPDDILMEAWGVIANARDWGADDLQGEVWRSAAERWRDRWHATLQEEG